jgi:hypothetical protein
MGQWLPGPVDVEAVEGHWVAVCALSGTLEVVDAAAASESAAVVARLHRPRSCVWAPGLGVVVRDGCDGERLQVRMSLLPTLVSMLHIVSITAWAPGPQSIMRGPMHPRGLQVFLTAVKGTT